LEEAVNKDIQKEAAQKAAVRAATAAPGTDKEEEVYTAGLFSLCEPRC
jgi:hypothetical protein